MIGKKFKRFLLQWFAFRLDQLLILTVAKLRTHESRSSSRRNANKRNFSSYTLFFLLHVFLTILGCCYARCALEKISTEYV